MLAVSLAALVLLAGFSPASAAQTEHTGTLRVLRGHSPDGVQQERLVLEQSGASSTVNALPGAVDGDAQLLDGRTVTVEGVKDADGTIHATDVQPTGPAPSDVGAEAITGSKPFINVLCKFSDIATEPKTQAQVQTMMANSFPGLDHYWRAMSFNQLDIAGSVVTTWYTLPNPRAFYLDGSGEADLDLLADHCTAAADADVNFPTFYGINTFYNGSLGCCAWGGGKTLTLDGQTKTYSFTWLPPFGQNHGVIGHEMGHAFTFPHSACPDGYGSQPMYMSDWDIMSGGSYVFNDPTVGWIGTGTIAYHKDKDGWIAAAKKLTATQGIINEILLQPINDATPVSGQHLMGIIPVSMPTRFYTVEARRKRGGYDDNIPLEGVVVHYVDTTRSFHAGHARGVDQSADTNCTDAGAQLVAGESWTDPSIGASVSVVASNGDGSYRVRIGLQLPGIVVTPSSVSVAEGGATATYNVKLASPPTANVTVAIGGTAGQVTAAPSPLTFTSANYNVNQTVTVNAIDDALAEGSPHTVSLTHTASSTDPGYSGLAGPPVLVNITDNEVGVELLQSGGTTAVAEGGATDTYTVKLLGQPTANVTFTGTASGGQVSLSPANLTFTSSNWATAQTVTVTAVNDAIDEASPHTTSINYAVSSSDTRYNNFPVAPVGVSITDNDTAGITLVQSGGSTTVNEGVPAGDTYTIVLASQPAANVSVSMTPASSQITVTPSTLTFTAANWNSAQTVTVRAVNDAIDEPTMTTSVSHTVSSTDPLYSPITIPTVPVTVQDDDVSGVAISQSGGNTAVAEGGATDTITVALTSQPAANVTVTLTNADGQLTRSPATLTFTSSNWSTPQTVTIGAFDDSIVESNPHTGSLGFTTSSADPLYNGLSIPAISVTITDNDDTQAPVSTFTTGNNALVVAGSAIRGAVTDNASGVQKLELTLRNLGTLVYRYDATLTCNAARTSCTWSVPTPLTLAPGIYTANARAIDMRNNQENPGPTIQIIVV